MKTNKIVALFLALAIVFSLFGCSRVQDNNQTTLTTTTSKITTNTTSKAITQATTEKASATNQSETSSTTTNTSTTLKASSTTTETTATTSKATTSSTTKKPTTTTKKEVTYCSLTIQCKNILSNMDDLASGHAEFVPSSGYLLSSYHYDIKGSTTAYDVLKAACSSNGIKLTTKSTVYGVYVVGINNLDEKDCGKYSGWKYKVNGKEPNRACDKYEINKGDKIEFFYVCTY